MVFGRDPQNLPTRFRESFSLTHCVLFSWFRALSELCRHCHIYPGLTTARVNQVRFRCMHTPRRGPNNKPLAFVVPGFHSYELDWAFLSVAPLVRLVAIQCDKAV